MKKREYEKLDLSNRLYKRYKEFTPILNEYFSRMKADMELTDEEINIKVDLLLKNVRKINFGIMPIIYKGFFRPDKRRITFNANLFNTKVNYEQLFNIITHELDHACCYDEENKKFGLYRYDKKSVTSFNPKDVFLDELKTDIGSTRRVFNNNYADEDKMIRHTYAYKNFSAFSTVLQNCLGITEKELLKFSDKGRVYFDEQMKTKFTNPKDYNRFMEKFALDTSVMLNIKTEKVEITPETVIEFNRAFYDLKSLSYIGLNLRMEKEVLENLDMNLDEYVKDMRYSIEQNRRNFEYANEGFAIDDFMNKLLSRVSDSYMFDVLDADESKNNNKEKNEIKSKSQNMLENKIMYLEMLMNNKDLIGDKYKEAVKQIAFVKNESELKKYSNEQLNLDFKDNKEEEFRKELETSIIGKRKAENEPSYSWDNRQVVEEIIHFFKINKRKGVSKINAKVMLMLYPETKKGLAASNEEKTKEGINELRSDMRKVIRSQVEISSIDKTRQENIQKNLKENNER